MMFMLHHKKPASFAGILMGRRSLLWVEKNDYTTVVPKQLCISCCQNYHHVYGHHKNKASHNTIILQETTHITNTDWIRHESIQSRQFSILDTFKKKSSSSPSPPIRDWHDPSFMKESTPEQKEEWLKSLLRETSNTNNDYYTTPTTDNIKDEIADHRAYLIVLQAWANSGWNGAPQKVEDWMNRLERHHHYAEAALDLHQNQDEQHEKYKIKVNALKPTVECYNAVMLAWAKSKDPNPTRVERWLNKLKQNEQQQQQQHGSSEGGNSGAVPNIDSYNLFLCTLSKGHGNAKAQKNNAIRAEKLLRKLLALQDEHSSSDYETRIIQPDTDSFNYVLRAFTRCRKDPEMLDNVMEMLRMMESIERKSDNPNESKVKPNTMSYCMAIDACCVQASLKAKRHFHSHQHTNGANVKNLPKDILDDINYDVEKAKEILKYMQDLNAWGNTSVIPNSVAYNTILGAYARLSNPANKEAPILAENLFRKMNDFYKEENSDIFPDQRSYSHIIRAWAELKGPTSGKRAEWWLRQSFKTSQVEPSIDMYNNLLRAYNYIGDTLNAERILLELLDNGNDNDTKANANSESYSMVIRTWLKFVKMNSPGEQGEDQIVQGCKKAHKWLSHLLDAECSGENNLSSSIDLFHSIFKTILQSEVDDKRLLFIALNTFAKLQESRHHVDMHSYRMLLEIGLRTLSSQREKHDRNKFIRRIVKMCCQDGLLTNTFLSLLANGPVERVSGWTVEESKRVCEDFFGEEKWPLPKSWSRNVKETYNLPSRKDLIRTRAAHM